MPPKVLNLPHLKTKTLKTKTIFLPIVLLLTSTFIAFSAPPEKHRLNFNVKGLQNTKCYMGFYYGDKTYVLDSANVDAKGNFHFAGDSSLTGGIYFVLLKSKKYFEFIIDKDQKFTMLTDTVDFIKNMKVEGSIENQDFYEYLNYADSKYTKMHKLQDSAKSQEQKASIKGKMDSLNIIVKKYKEDFMAKHPDFLMSEIFKAAEVPDVPETPTLPNGRKDSTFAYRYYKAHFFDNINFSDDKMVHTPPEIFFNRIKEYFSRLTFPIPDSINAAADYLIAKARKSPDMFKFLLNYVTYTYANSDIMGMDAVYVHMVKTYYTPQNITWESASQLEKMRENANQLEPVLIGKKAPSMVLSDTSNVMTALDSIKTRYTIVVFWDYDCGLCQQEIPKLIKWYDAHKDQGIEVYAVEINDNEVAKWKEYIKKHKLDWINVSDIFHTSNYHHDYDVISTPIIYVLDENKHIIAKKIDVKDLDGVLKHDMQINSMKK
jgi:thiol-disulfide isomerase/thioredoxin